MPSLFSVLGRPFSPEQSPKAGSLHHHRMAQLTQSPSDAKSYRHLTLPNGLAVLLVHDPAVADALEAGEGQPPRQQQHQAGGGGASTVSEDDDDAADDEGGTADEEEEGSSGSSSGSDASSSESGPRDGKQGGTKKAAAAMAVGVGSFSDPREMQGLSHFLEHMLFMGSDKFRDENEYDAFLTSHGGTSNAFTELEHTNYFFDVAAPSLEGALDRFAQFFVAPLFQPGALEREVQAVDSEFKGVLQSDHSRLTQLMCHTCRPGHVYSKFSWGNLVSLWEAPRQAGLDVRAAIIDYYKQQYGPERMSLVVLGGQPLDTLQEWVVRLFGGIPRGTVGPPADFAAVGPPFEGRRLYVAPAVKEHHEVTVTFQLPSLRSEYASKPEHYISHLVGHEGPGSLLSALKARGWAHELCAGVDDDGFSANTAAYLFTVSIVLTEAGLHAAPGFGLAPVALLFAYLKLLGATGPQVWVWEELRAISDMKFRFMEEEDSCEFVSRVASTMGWVAPQHLLVADYLHTTWAPDKVMQLLSSAMHPADSSYRIDLLTRSYDRLKEQLLGGACPEPVVTEAQAFTEPWFSMQGVRCELAPALTAQWAAADADSGLSLPPANPFIPSDFDIKAAGPSSSSSSSNGQGNSDAAAGSGVDAAQIPQWLLAGSGRPTSLARVLSSPPAMICDEPGLRVWHKLATSYGQPRIVSYFRLSSPVAAASPTACVLCALWLRLVEEARAEDSYLADVAGLHWSSSPEGLAGLEVRADGFSHKLHILTQRVFDCLAGCKVTAQAFPAVREELLRRYRNALLRPDHAATALRLQLLSGGPAWTHDQLAEALTAVTDLDQAKAFASDFLSHCHLECLTMGNVTAAEATQLCRSVASTIAGATALRQPPGSVGGLQLPAAARPQESCVQLPAATSLLHKAAARNPQEDNCCVEVYYQIGLSSDDLRLRVLADLVDQVLAEPLYDTLRTKQQLGYTVSSGTRMTHGVTGFCVVVVSAAFDADTVEARIEAFMQHFSDTTLQGMADDDLSRHKAALLANKLAADTSLGQEGDRAWEQVFSTRYEFLCREQEAAVLADITLADLRAFFATHLAPGSAQRRRACVQVIPSARDGPPQHEVPVHSSTEAAPQHVRHEFGAVRAHGGHAGDSGAAAEAAGDASGTPAAASAARHAKRPKLQQAAPAAAPALQSGLQAAKLWLVDDLEACKATLGRFAAYRAVEPQLPQNLPRAAAAGAQQ